MFHKDLIRSWTKKKCEWYKH